MCDRGRADDSAQWSAVCGTPECRTEPVDWLITGQVSYRIFLGGEGGGFQVKKLAELIFFCL